MEDHTDPIYYYAMDFERKMFLGMARVLNVVCYEIGEPNLYEKGKLRFVLLKTPYNFEPGSNRVV